MNKFSTIKNASQETGLPMNLLSEWAHMTICRNAFHRFGDKINSPIYVDIDELVKLIRSGDLDK